MLTLMSSISAAIRSYLRFYLPINIAIDLLRKPRGLKWAVPVAVVSVPTYLFATTLCATIVELGGPDWLNVVEILFFWNAVKFAWLAVLTLLCMQGGCMGHKDVLEQQLGCPSERTMCNVDGASSRHPTCPTPLLSLELGNGELVPRTFPRSVRSRRQPSGEPTQDGPRLKVGFVS